MKPKPKDMKISPLVILPDFFASAESFSPLGLPGGQSPLLHGATVELSPGQ